MPSRTSNLKEGLTLLGPKRLRVKVIRSDVESLYGRHADFSERLAAQQYLQVTTASLEYLDGEALEADCVLIQEDTLLSQSDSDRLVRHLGSQTPVIVLRQPSVEFALTAIGLPSSLGSRVESPLASSVNSLPESKGFWEFQWPRQVNLPIEIRRLNYSFEDGVALTECGGSVLMKSARGAAAAISRCLLEGGTSYALAFSLQSIQQSHLDLIINLLISSCNLRPSTVILGMPEDTECIEPILVKSALAGVHCAVSLVESPSDVSRCLELEPLRSARRVIAVGSCAQSDTVISLLHRWTSGGGEVEAMMPSSNSVMRGEPEVLDVADMALSWIASASPEVWGKSILCLRSMVRLERVLNCLRTEISTKLAYNTVLPTLSQVEALIAARVKEDGSIDYEVGISCAALEVLNHFSGPDNEIIDSVQKLSNTIRIYLVNSQCNTSDTNWLQAARHLSGYAIPLQVNQSHLGAVPLIEAFLAGQEIENNRARPEIRSSAEASEIVFLLWGHLESGAVLPRWCYDFLETCAAMVREELLRLKQSSDAATKASFPAVVSTLTAALILNLTVKATLPTNSKESTASYDSNARLRLILQKERRELQESLAQGQQLHRTIDRKEATLRRARVTLVSAVMSLFVSIAVIHYQSASTKPHVLVAIYVPTFCFVAIVFGAFDLFPSRFGTFIRAVAPEWIRSRADRLISKRSPDE